MRLIERVWFESHPAKWLLVPLLMPVTLIFWLITSVRRWCYRKGIKKSIPLAKPIVVIGNIGVGGNGKTPLTLYLIEQLKRHGLSVGVVSRGYGGKAPYYPFQLTDTATADQVGDEPLLIYRRTDVHVVIGADRVAAAQKLVDLQCDIILADDGLQHYRLARDYEIAVVDGKRMFGNRFLLPSGPLRETVSRLKSVNSVVVNGHLTENLLTDYRLMSLRAYQVINLLTGDTVALSTFVEKNSQVNAIAGIGDPARFFQTLADNGFTIAKSKGFVDHQAYSKQMFSSFCSALPLLMTEKDAVKCLTFARSHWWYVPVDASFADDSQDSIIHDILNLINDKRNDHGI